LISFSKEIIIIGQGLAGSTLALTLEEQGILPRVIDNTHHHAASSVAAGLWNPVSFRNMKSVWLAADCLKFNSETYPRWEQKLKARFYHPSKLTRIHSSAEEINNWDLAQEQNPYLLNHKEISALENKSMGGGEVADCGWVDVSKFIETTCQHLLDQNRLIHEKITKDAIDKYLSTGATVILCTGYQSPWPWWPVQPNKGEVLELSSKNIFDGIMHFSHFVIPIGGHRVKLGSTYQLDPQSIEPTPSGRNELEKSFKKNFGNEFEVIQHLAGYRPTTPDRRPVIGKISENQSLYVMSGMGSRGVLMAPLMARMLTLNILFDTKIHPEADVCRYLLRKSSNHIRG